VIANGEFVTNCHVIDHANWIGGRYGKTVFRSVLRFYDKTGTYVSYMPWIRLPLPYPVRGIVSMDDLHVGQKVYSIGSPRGLELTLSDGLISGLRQSDDGSTRFI
jgi:S1-C subfamily serine protease